MFRFLVLSALVACAFGNVIQPRTLPDGRIVGGSDTTVEEHPHQVSVRLLDMHNCGGSILGSKKVLTAAHCCRYRAEQLSVQYGVSNIETNENVISVAKVISHPGYNPSTIENDACILLLESDIVFSDSAQPIEAARKEPSAGAKAVVTGWGDLTYGGSSPEILQEVEVYITDRQACSDSYSYRGGITDSMLCAGVAAGGKDSCKGDSGGPLVSDGKLVGVVSFGRGCALADFPGIYANVAGLIDWIESQ